MEPNIALTAWNQKVLKAVSDLDPSYGLEFSNQSNLVMMVKPIQFDGLPETDPHVQVYQWVVWRMDKLQALTADLRKGHVISMQ